MLHVSILPALNPEASRTFSTAYLLLFNRSFHAAGILAPMLSISYDALLAAVHPHNSSLPQHVISVMTPQTQEEFLVSALLLIKTVVECPSYKAKTAGGNTANVDNEQVIPLIEANCSQSTQVLMAAMCCT
jgi:hypothetical protein